MILTLCLLALAAVCAIATVLLAYYRPAHNPDPVCDQCEKPDPECEKVSGDWFCPHCRGDFRCAACGYGGAIDELRYHADWDVWLHVGGGCSAQYVNAMKIGDDDQYRANQRKDAKLK